MNLHPPTPLKFQFGPTVTSLFIHHGIVGLQYDTFIMNEYDQSASRVEMVLTFSVGSFKVCL